MADDSSSSGDEAAQESAPLHPPASAAAAATAAGGGEDKSTTLKKSKKPKAAKPKKPKLQNKSLIDLEVLPNNKSSMILRLTSQMFHKHSDMLLQQASVLERIATNPSDPESWKIEEPSPESIADKVYHENATVLAIKSYESMLEVQKRVDCMERLMINNGIHKGDIKRARNKKNRDRKRQKLNPPRPYDFFRQDHIKRLALDMNQLEGSSVVVKEVDKLWRSLNPGGRLKYKEMADAAAARISNKNHSVSEKNSEQEGVDAASGESSDGIDEDKLLFQLGTEEGQKSNAEKQENAGKAKDDRGSPDAKRSSGGGNKNSDSSSSSSSSSSSDSDTDSSDSDSKDASVALLD